MADGYLTPWRRGSLTAPATTGSLFDLHRQMNRLFDDLFETRPSSAFGFTPAIGSGWPQLEIERQDDRIQVVAELPGVDEKDVELSIEDGVLSLSGEKRSERKDESGYSERSYGRFERRIALPTDVDEAKCTADFKNGVLTVTLPRSEAKSRGRRIPLSASGKPTEPRRVAQNDEPERSLQQAAEEPRREERDEGQQA